MKYLPPEIWRLIYTYDDTYKIIFNDTIKKLNLSFFKYNWYVHHYLFHCAINNSIKLKKRTLLDFAKERKSAILDNLVM